MLPSKDISPYTANAYCYYSSDFSRLYLRQINYRHLRFNTGKTVFGDNHLDCDAYLPVDTPLQVKVSVLHSR